MLVLHLVPSIYSFTAAVTACSTGAWVVAIQVFSQMLAVGILPDTVSYNAVLSAAEHSKQWLIVFQLLSSMLTSATEAEPNEISFTAAIGISDKGGGWQLAPRLLSDMPLVRV